ncbi:MAG TPA: FxLYD domain-containing protein [Fimbriimonadaceae bacterium]|nr:FxLYD domain-containing protein [Fimbriimonadaceae bacterium]
MGGVGGRLSGRIGFSIALLILAFTGCSGTKAPRPQPVVGVSLESVQMLTGADGQLAIEGLVTNGGEKSVSGVVEFAVFDAQGSPFGHLRVPVESVPARGRARFAIPVPPHTKGFVWSGFFER